MTIEINLITQNSNKTIEIIDTSGNIVSTNTSNELIELSCNNSYVLYIEPEIVDISYSEFLSITTSIFSGVLGYIWIIAIGIIFYVLLRSLKNHV